MTIVTETIDYKSQNATVINHLLLLEDVSRHLNSSFEAATHEIWKIQSRENKFLKIVISDYHYSGSVIPWDGSCMFGGIAFYDKITNKKFNRKDVNFLSSEWFETVSICLSESTHDMIIPGLDFPFSFVSNDQEILFVIHSFHVHNCLQFGYEISLTDCIGFFLRSDMFKEISRYQIINDFFNLHTTSQTYNTVTVLVEPSKCLVFQRLLKWKEVYKTPTYGAFLFLDFTILRYQYLCTSKDIAPIRAKI